MLASFDHPSLVKVHRFWKSNCTAYMAMQYYPGQTLRDVRSAMTAPPDESWLRAFIDPLLGALEVLHQQGVYHRDIAPDNILLLPDGRPVLLDFGSARRVIGDLTQSLTAVLKPNFSPIEQYADEVHMRQGDWTDLYSLGATVHFMVTGKTPTPAVMRVVRDVLPALSNPDTVYSGVSARFLAAIDWTLALPLEDRPQSVAALRQALDGEFVPPSPTPRYLPVERSESKTETRSGSGDNQAIDNAPTRLEPRSGDDFPRTLVAAPAFSAIASVDAPASPAPPTEAGKRRRWSSVATAVVVVCLCSIGLATIRHSSHAAITNAASTTVAVASPSAPELTPLLASPTRDDGSQLSTASPAQIEADVTPAAAPIAHESVKPETANRSVPRRKAQVQEAEKVVSTGPAVSEQRARVGRAGDIPMVAPVDLARRPAEVCGSLNFFARAICYRRECRSPQWRTDPQCAEAKTVEDAQQRRGQF
jgi:serine/threonine protein kinase